MKRLIIFMLMLFAMIAGVSAVDINLYYNGEKLDGNYSNSSAFTNIENAFDGNDSSYAQNTPNTAIVEIYLGKQFDREKYVETIDYKIAMEGYDGGSSRTWTLYLQTYDGSTWSDHTLIHTNTGIRWAGVSGFTTYTGEISLNETINGYRFRAYAEGGNINVFTMRAYIDDAYPPSEKPFDYYNTTNVSYTVYDNINGTINESSSFYTSIFSGNESTYQTRKNGDIQGYTFNDGTNNGAIIEDGAMSFDGVNDYVSSTTSFNTSQVDTLCSWININSNTTLSGVVGYGAERKQILVNGDGRFRFSSGTLGQRDFSEYGVTPNNTWQFVCADFINRKIYINGVDSTGTLTTIAISTDVNVLTIGSFTTSTLFFNGSINGVTIYDRALNTTEITEIYNAGRYAYTPIGQNLLAQFNVVGYENGSTPATIFDTNHLVSSPIKNEITAIDGINYTNKAMHFDGVNDYVNLEAKTVDLSSESISFSGWIKPIEACTGQTQNECTLFGTRANIGVTLQNTGSIKAWNGGTANVYGIGSSLVGDWYHIAVSYVGNGDVTRYVYINGNLVGTDTTGTISTRTYQYIGGQSNQWFNGSIDDVRIYNRTLSEEEIQNLYYFGLGNNTNQINTTRQVLEMGMEEMQNSLIHDRNYQICVNCQSTTLDLTLQQGFYTEWFYDEDNNVTNNAYFTIDLTNPSLTDNLSTEYNSSYTINLTNYISYSDALSGINYCTVNFTTTSQTTACNNESFIIAQNGNISYNIVVEDNAGNQNTSSGVLFVNPTQYVYFEEANGTQITNFSINGTTYATVFNPEIFDYGYGNFTFEFQKVGYVTTTFTLNLNSTSDINVTYTMPGSIINIFIYDRTTRDLINGTNITIEMAGSFGATRYTTNGTTSISSLDINSGNYSILASGTGYQSETKTFTFTNQEIINVSIYMLQSTLNNTGTQNVYVENGFGVGLENIPVRLNEWYAADSEFRVVSEKTSQHPFGKVTFDVEQGTKLYRICAYPDSGEIYCHEDIIIDENTDDIYIPILENELTNSDFTYDYSVSCTNTSVSGGTQVDMTFSDSTTQITKFCIEVFSKINRTVTKIDESCVNTYEGSISETYLHANTTTILTKGFAYVGTESIPVCSISSATTSTLEEAVDDYGLELIFPVFFALLLVGFGYAKKKLEYGIMALVILLFGLAYSFPSTFTITMAIIGFVIAVIAFIIIEVRKG